jgi:glycosyltransferase involved in cell wall biosynthesis
MFFSVIVPVYNRPKEIQELLESLCRQTFGDFEVLIIEDGSDQTCEKVVETFKEKLSLRYFYQNNTGQGFARNFGMQQALGKFYILLDSDCIAPPQYLETVKHHLEQKKLDAFGGPDEADEDFSPLQKAINFSMTSVFTTGGIRGKLPDPSKYQARGYNMGMSKAAYRATNGFVDPNRGEDIELSIRLKKMGFKLELIKEAYVFHKRRNTFFSFLQQSYSFGRNRVNVSRFHPEAIKWVHMLPLFFLLGVLSLPLWYQVRMNLFLLGMGILALWSLGVVIASARENKSLLIGLFSFPVAIGQLMAYGAGLGMESLRKMFKG